jgi:hypothetical protein
VHEENLLGVVLCTKEEKDVDFLVERPPREVLDKAEICVSAVKQGSHRNYIAVYSDTRTQKRVLKDVANYFGQYPHRCAEDKARGLRSGRGAYSSDDNRV